MLMLSLDKHCIMCEGCISAVCIISNSGHVKLHQHVGVTDVLNIQNVAFHFQYYMCADRCGWL